MIRLLLVFTFCLFAEKVISRSSHHVQAAEAIVSADLIGQLGNQLFQIAAACSLAWDHNAEPIFPALQIKKQWDIPLNYQHVFSKLNTRALKTKPFIYQENSFHFSPIPYRPNMQLYGYFQSEKYFINHKEKILELFEPSEAIKKYLSSTYTHILHHPNTVAVHIRSYYHEDATGTYHPFIGWSYLRKAMNFFPKDTLFVVFSNKINWVKENFIIENFDFENIIFIENEPHYHDFYLMSMCHHQIISNSSFSWWAAYLNKNPHKTVIAPQRWFGHGFQSKNHNLKDLFPNTWIIFSCD